MTERVLEAVARRTIRSIMRLLRTPQNPLGFVKVALNEEYKSQLMLLENGVWRIASDNTMSRGSRDIQTTRKKNLDEILEVFALLTDPDMEKFVGPAFLYDEDWRMYHKRREEYVKIRKHDILVSFVTALRQSLLELVQVNPPLAR